MAGIFISYRRDDVAGQVGRLFGRLAAHYGEDFIFMDVESIRPSQQFESVRWFETSHPHQYKRADLRNRVGPFGVYSLNLAFARQG